MNNDACQISLPVTSHNKLLATHRLVGLVVKAFASEEEDLGFESVDFSWSSHTSDLKIGTPVAIPCQAPGTTGSALGLVDPVSVYCDRVR